MKMKLIACLFLTVTAAKGLDATWNGTTDSTLGNEANWEAGTCPEAGADILFKTASKTYNQNIESFSPRSILFTNETTATHSLTFTNLPITVASGGLAIDISPAISSIFWPAGFSGSGPLCITMPPTTQMNIGFRNGNDGFTGKITLDGRVYVEVLGRITTLGDETPETVIPDAITLDHYAALKNYQDDLTIPAWQGITLGETGGGFIAGWGGLGRDFQITVNGPITGAGRLYIGNCVFPVTLNGEGTWQGGTDIGSMAPGGAYGGNNAMLILGDNATFPEGNELIIGEGGAATFDVNGHSISVSNLVIGAQGVLKNSSETPAVIHAQEATIAGSTVVGDVTIDCPSIHWVLSEDEVVTDPALFTEVASETTLTLDDMSATGGRAIKLAGGTLALPAHNGFTETMVSKSDVGSYYYTIDTFQSGAVMGLRSDWPEYTTYFYKSQWYVPEGQGHRFLKQFDDVVRLRIDGVDVIRNGTSNARILVENYFLAAGWHDVSIWFSNAGGASGPNQPADYRSGLMWGHANDSLVNDGDGKTFDTADAVFVHAPVIDRPLYVGANGGTVSIMPQESLTATPSIILRGGVIATEDIGATDFLTFTDDVIVGTRDPNAAAVFDAPIALAGGKTLTFEGYVWLKRLPPAGYRVMEGTVFFLSPETVTLKEDLARAGGAIALAPFNFDAYTDAAIAVGAEETLMLFSGSTMIGNQPSLNDREPVVCGRNIAVAADGLLEFRNTGDWRQEGVLSGGGTVWMNGGAAVDVTGDNGAFAGTLLLKGGTVAFGQPSSAGSAAATVIVDTPTRFADAEEPGAVVYPQRYISEASGAFICGGHTVLNSLTVTNAASRLTIDEGDCHVASAALTAPNGLALGGSGRLVLDISSENYILPPISGDGSLYLDGEGSVDALNAVAFGGTFAFAPGVRLTVTPPRPIDGAALWLDASSTDSMILSGNDVQEWHDVRDGATGSTYPHTYLTTKMAAWDRHKTSYPPELIQDETLAPGMAVDFGEQNSGKWFAFSREVNAQTIFYVIGSQKGGGCCFFSCSTASVGICRNGPNGVIDNVTITAGCGLYNPNNWSSTLFSKSYTRVNGEVCNPTTTGLSGAYDIVSTRLSGTQALDGMAKDLRPLTGGHADGTKRSGGMRFAEIIIYDRALTDVEIVANETYLKNKWFPREVMTPAITSWTGSLRIDGTNTIDVSPQVLSLSVNELVGNGTLIKRGDGELQLDYMDNFGGTVSVAEGDLTLGMGLPEPAFWVDASQASSIGTDDDGRFYWRDRRWDGVTDYVVATQRWTVAPTVMPNALNTLPVVELGKLSATHDRGLQWSRNINASTIFMVIGSQNSGGTILGTTDNDTVFNRGNIANAATPIYHASWTHANVRNGLTRLDGVEVDGTVTGFNGGYQVLAIRPTAEVKVGQFAHDRELDATKTRDGGQRLGEVLIFTNKLSDVQFSLVEQYLCKRWLQGDVNRTLYSADGFVEHRVETVEVGEDAASLNAAHRAAVTVGTLQGDGAEVEKYGDSVLTVHDASSFDGRLTVKQGRFVLGNVAQKALADATFWVDASKPDTLTIDEATQEVTVWEDCRFNGRNAHRHPQEQSIVKGTPFDNLNPVLLSDELNGLPVLDFGEWRGNRFLVFDRPISNIRTVFWVIGSQAGGGILLGYSGDTGIRDFYRAGQNGTTNFDEIDASNPIWARNVAGACTAVCDAPTRLNGETVDGAAVGLSGGYDIVSVRATANVRASAFGMDRDRQYRNSTGGQRLAEVIIFSRELSDEETDAIELYLSQKWGVPIAHTDPIPATAELADLLVSRGAALTFSAAGDYLVGSVGGLGSVEADGRVTLKGLASVPQEEEGDQLTVAGDLTIADEAVWTVDATDGTPAPIMLSGTLTFAGGGTIQLTGDAGNAPVKLAQGESVEGFDISAWRVVSDGSKRYILKYHEDEQAVYLELVNGLILIFK